MQKIKDESPVNLLMKRFLNFTVILNRQAGESLGLKLYLEDNRIIVHAVLPGLLYM